MINISILSLDHFDNGFTCEWFKNKYVWKWRKWMVCHRCAKKLYKRIQPTNYEIEFSKYFKFTLLCATTYRLNLYDISGFLYGSPISVVYFLLNLLKNSFAIYKLFKYIKSHVFKLIDCNELAFIAHHGRCTFRDKRSTQVDFPIEWNSTCESCLSEIS